MRLARIDQRRTHDMYTTLISVEQLQQLQAGDTPFMVFYCTFDHKKPE